MAEDQKATIQYENKDMEYRPKRMDDISDIRVNSNILITTSPIV